ncbi:uncharacterized protein LOC120524841 [Polypterus senegalus]|uniref:uncharacterized protein LOC120524841 n=1 Tax=Polypterus senegalus TaxID=55291 RepID=UPI001965216C|nr:uncharacterized protein LOC120524841 [Polypterus senegalus]
MIASALDDVHCQYKIRDKVVRTTTDSGSNFIKAFHVFGAQNDAEVDEDDADLDALDVSDHIEYHDTSIILDEDSGMEYQLPPHQRCACHLLNLVAAADTALAECMNDTFKRLFRATFAKCQGIWNKTGRSSLASEVVEDKCGLQIIRPSATRWNSTYLAIERIIRIIDEKGEDAMRSVCDEFKVKMLSPAEVAFLREHCITMTITIKSFKHSPVRVQHLHGMAAASNPPTSIKTEQAGDIKQDLQATHQSPAKWPADAFWIDDGGSRLGCCCSPFPQVQDLLD